ncbi:MAG: hypothetical protein HY908_32640 [Myxococcales bacterium]|nr:hypothetical protein [Myxococcales bacterium]
MSKGAAYAFLPLGPLGLLPLVLAVVGAAMINADAGRGYDAARTQVVQAALARLGPRYRPQNTVTVGFWHGTSPFIAGALHHEFAVLVAEEHALGVCEGAAWGFERNLVRPPAAAREVPYETITNVQEINGQLLITLAAGGAISFITKAGALDAASAIRARVHQRQAAASQRQPVLHQIVERQVVVMRCRYCGQLTAAELRACQSCGAMMGGA